MFNWRFFVPFLAILVCMSIFFHFVWLPNFINQERQSHIENIKINLKLLSTTLIPSILSGDLAEIHQNLAEITKSRKEWRYVELLDSSNNRLYPFNSSDKNVVSNPELSIFAHTIKNRNKTIGTLSVTLDLESLFKDKLEEIRNLEFWTLIIIQIFIVGSAFFTRMWLKKPLEELISATAKIAKGEFDTNLPKNMKGELFEFVTSFDQMRHILKDKDKRIKRQQAISDAIREVQAQFISSDDTFTIFNRLLDNTIKLTSSKIGFIGEIFYDDNGKPYLETYALTNISWDVESRKLYEQSIEGSMRFTNTQTLFGQVMVTGQPLICNDPQNDPRSSGTPHGHPELKNFFGMPLYNRKSKLMGMIGVANANNGYDENLIQELSVLWLVIGNLFDAQHEQQALIESENKLRAIVDNAVEAIITIDSNGTIQTFNPAAEKTFGYGENEVVGKNIKTLMPNKFSTQHDIYLSNYINGGKAKIIGTGREVVGLRKNGEEFPMELSVAEVNKQGNRYFTGIVRDITERKQKVMELDKARNELFKANTKLENLVRLDPLTNIANRRHYDEKILEEFNRAMRQKQVISLLMLDIDHFKNYNDHYGHAAGDDCLKQVANAINAVFKRSGELMARYGGEEFAVILPHTPEPVAIKMAELVIENVKKHSIPHAASPVSDIVTVSIGLSSGIPIYKKDTVELFQKKADDALYRAKDQGRNRIAT